jgi:hypothetical protein
MILCTGAAGYVACAEAIRDMSLCDHLPEIFAPTLVMVGEDDRGPARYRLQKSCTKASADQNWSLFRDRHICQTLNKLPYSTMH